MPGISMRHFSCGSFISDYGIRQLALCLWVFVQREDAPCAGAPLLKTSAKAKELWQYCLSPAVRVLSSSGAERTIYGPLLGFRGQKHISQSDSAKLNKSSAAEKRWMSAPTSPTLGVPAGFFFPPPLGTSDLSKHSLIKLCDMLCWKFRQMECSKQMRKNVVSL